MEDDLSQAFIMETIDEAVRAEEEAVPRLIGNGADLGIDELVARAEGFMNAVTKR